VSDYSGVTCFDESHPSGCLCGKSALGAAAPATEDADIWAKLEAEKVSIGPVRVRLSSGVCNWIVAKQRCSGLARTAYGATLKEAVERFLGMAGAPGRAAPTDDEVAEARWQRQRQDAGLVPEGVSGPEPTNTEAKLHLLVAHLEALDSQLTRLGEGEFVEGYQMKTGAWHRILGIIRGDPMLALRLDMEMQVPFARAAEEAYRKAGEVSQADLQSEVRVSGPDQGAAGADAD
jgi:hypothetical protein